MGVPACALFHKATSFDILLPRVLAGVEMKRFDLAGMAESGFYLNCKTCVFPQVPLRGIAKSNMHRSVPDCPLA